MSSQDQSSTFHIPRVDLEDYRFSPPGSMGWNAAEYEQILIHPDAAVHESARFLPPTIPKTSLEEIKLNSGSSDDQNKGEEIALKKSEAGTLDGDSGGDKDPDSQPTEVNEQHAEDQSMKQTESAQEPGGEDKEKIEEEKAKEKVEEKVEEEVEEKVEEKVEEEEEYKRSPYPPASPWLNNKNVLA